MKMKLCVLDGIVIWGYSSKVFVYYGVKEVWKYDSFYYFCKMEFWVLVILIWGKGVIVRYVEKN